MKRQWRQLLSTFGVAVAVALPLRAEQSAQTQTRPFMWKITSAHATAYLLGSVHVARPDIYPLDERIIKAYDASDVLVVEAAIAGSPDADTSRRMLIKALYPPTDNLAAHISPELYEKTAQRAAKYGMEMAMLRQFKPWFIAMTISMIELRALGIMPEYGIDVHFQQRAAVGNKKMLELEGVDAQLDLFESMSDREQELFLKHTLMDLDYLAEHVEEILAAWKRGDRAKFEELFKASWGDFAGMGPMYKRLIDDRNEKMLTKIEQWLTTNGTYFIVVGAGHVVGENGLVQMLSKKYDVRQF